MTASKIPGYRQFGVPEYNDDERELAVIEESWADHLRGLRTGTRVREKAGRPHWRAGSLQQVATMLDYFRSEFEAGNKAAMMDALLTTADENVPMPYWLADALNDAVSSVLEGKTLHEAVGYEKRFPTSTKAATKARRDWLRKQQFYVDASYLAATGTPKTKAIESVRKKMGIARTTAWRWYGEQDRIQQAASEAWRGPRRQVHKLR